ncbi:hypothetical protein [Actinophytocola sp. KF-1]
MRYTTFSLYWERWGGYPGRDHPFGAPSLTRVLATSSASAVTLVEERPSGTGVVTVARTSPLAMSAVAPLPGLIAAALATSPLISEPGGGDYQVVDDLTGFSDGPFHLTLAYTVPSSAVWSPAARRLMDALNAIRSVADLS